MTYITYSSPESRATLNLNNANTPISVFPRDIYTGDLVAPGPGIRDRHAHYTYDPDGSAVGGKKERITHAPYHSRFAYDRVPNEYGIGNTMRGYVEADTCHKCNDLPVGMAPKRFYSAARMNMNRSDFDMQNR
jgi:hypothetical protein